MYHERTLSSPLTAFPRNDPWLGFTADYVGHTLVALIQSANWPLALDVEHTWIASCCFSYQL